MNHSIVDAKKNSLDLLDNEVQAAEYTASELQAVVTALKQKSSEFAEFLRDAEESKETSLSNLNLFKATLNSAKELQQNAKILNKQADKANAGIGHTAEHVSELIKQLIYSGEMVNNFAQQVFKKKQMNPLTSDELVKTVSTATADVNEAIASTLTALQSCYSSKGVAGESAGLSQIQLKQANGLLEVMTGKKLNPYTPSATKPVMYNITTLDTLFDNVETAEGIAKKALDGEHTDVSDAYLSVEPLVKQIFEILENGMTLRQKVTDIEFDLYVATLDKADAKRIRALNAKLKNAKTQYEQNHQELLNSVSQLISICEASGHEKCSVKLAQQYLQECQALFKDKEVDKVSREKTVEKLRTKIRNTTDLVEKIELELKLRSEEAMIEYDVILLECKERTLNLANQWLATANAHFRAADAALEEANNTLSSAVSQAQVSPKTKSIDSLQSYLVDGYQDALEHYRAALKANDVATQQLDGAQAKLDNATHQLNSLKAGLSAATAAALAA
ncbi:MAG: hypothetical protein ACI9XU_000229 [Arenicella sp.]|jgi:hypothetical protein